MVPSERLWREVDFDDVTPRLMMKSLFPEMYDGLITLFIKKLEYEKAIPRREGSLFFWCYRYRNMVYKVLCEMEEPHSLYSRVIVKRVEEISFENGIV